MKIKSKKVLEYTTVNGKVYPKKTLYIVDKVPIVNKNNNSIIEHTFKDEYLRMDSRK